MPKQETCFEKQNGDSKVEVLKSYDEAYAHEVFRNMDDTALKHLWDALQPEAIYQPESLPTLGDPGGEGEAFLWDELLEQSREHGGLRSFFIVNEFDGRHTEGLYVSPDWPSAESFAHARLRLHG